MLDFKINNRSLVLDSGTPLSLEILSPLFNADQLPGAYSFPFSVPACPVNDDIFNLPRIIDNVAVFEADYSAALIIGGSLFNTGIVNVQRYESGKYNIIYASQISMLKTSLDGKKLVDLDLGGDRVFGTTTDDIIAHAKTVIKSAVDAYDYTFPTISNSNFYDGKNIGYGGFLNRYDHAGDAFPKNTLVNIDPNFNNIDCLVPMPRVQYLLKQIFDKAGLILRGEFMDDAEMKQLIVYSNSALDDKHADTHHSKTILATAFSAASGQVIFDNDSTGVATDPGNDYNTTTGEYTIPASGTYTITFDLQAQIPSTGLNNGPIFILLNTLKLYLNGSPLESDVATGYYTSQTVQNASHTHTWTGYFTPADVGKKITFLFSQTVQPLFGGAFPLTIDVQAGTSMDVNIVSAAELNVYTNTINLVNHVPDMLATDFLLAILQLPLLKMDFEQGTNVVYLNFANNIVKSTKYSDITKITEPDPTIEKQKDTGQTYNYDFPSSDTFTSNNFKQQTGKTVLGTYATTAALPATPPPNVIAYVLNMNATYQTVYNASTALYDWQYVTDNYFPLIKGAGQTQIKPTLSPMLMRNYTIFSSNQLVPIINEVGSSKFFENGINLQQNIRLLFYRGFVTPGYPFATSLNYDVAGLGSGNYNLSWDGSAGIYNTFHKAFMDIQASARVTTHKINFTEAHLNSLNIFEKQLILTQQYFISRIRVNIYPDKIETAIVETYSIQ